MKKLLTGLLLVFILASCSEDEPGSDNNYDKLTSDDWHFTAWTMQYEYAGTSYTTDLYANPDLAFVDSCIMDDYLTFYNDHAYQTKPGAIICTPEVSLFGSGEWQILGDTISLEPFGLSSAFNFNLIELSDTMLSFSRTLQLSDPNGSNTIDGLETFTYKHH